MISMETFSVLDMHLGYWLRRVSNRVSGNFARALQARQTSVAEWVMLCRLRERPGITPKELAEALGMTPGAVSKVIDKLEAKQWIRSARNREDQRVRMLTLTRQGTVALPRLAEIAGGNDQQFFDCLNAGEKATLRRLLEKLAEHHEIRDVPIE
ncbi:MAG: MarR family transcriptional regulator [Bryobacterales bacterium]|nr:MarR family transcriptional regulator [Bryobacterales bacterium]